MTAPLSLSDYITYEPRVFSKDPRNDEIRYFDTVPSPEIDHNWHNLFESKNVLFGQSSPLFLSLLIITKALRFLHHYLWQEACFPILLTPLSPKHRHSPSNNERSWPLRPRRQAPGWQLYGLSHGLSQLTLSRALPPSLTNYILLLTSSTESHLSSPTSRLLYTATEPDRKDSLDTRLPHWYLHLHSKSCLRESEKGPKSDAKNRTLPQYAQTIVGMQCRHDATDDEMGGSYPAPNG